MTVKKTPLIPIVRDLEKELWVDLESDGSHSPVQHVPVLYKHEDFDEYILENVDLNDLNFSLKDLYKEPHFIAKPIVPNTYHIPIINKKSDNTYELINISAHELGVPLIIKETTTLNNKIQFGKFTFSNGSLVYSNGGQIDSTNQYAIVGKRGLYKFEIDFNETSEINIVINMVTKRTDDYSQCKYLNCNMTLCYAGGELASATGFYNTNIESDLLIVLFKETNSSNIEIAVKLSTRQSDGESITDPHYIVGQALMYNRYLL